MYAKFYSSYALFLFVIFLSCRSEARESKTYNEIDPVSATIAQEDLKITKESVDSQPLSNSELEKKKKVLAKELVNEELANDSKIEVTQVSTNLPEVKETESMTISDTPGLLEEQEAAVEVVSEEILTDLNNDAQEPPVDEISESKEVVSTPSPIVEEALTDISPAIAHIHDDWDRLLKKYVTAAGFVDYKGMLSESDKLDAYLVTLAANKPKDNDLSKEAMAYYINVYNAATVKLILDNYPVASITEINGGKPWDKKWILLGNETYSLNNIEHDILRPRFKDERVHFAVNCASASCPKIANRAFYGIDLEEILEKLTNEFVNDPNLNTIESKSIELSKIFQWYQGDFPDLVDFLNRYSDVKVKSSAKKTYKDYDWNLNGK